MGGLKCEDSRAKQQLYLLSNLNKNQAGYRQHYRNMDSMDNEPAKDCKHREIKGILHL